MADKRLADIIEGKKQAKGSSLGITVKKEDDFSEWYQQLITKAELIEYTSVSGCIVFRPAAFGLWENIQKFLDSKFKASGVSNSYFPLFIPESLLTKESNHVKGFTPEVAWVTHAGNTKLAERLAIRPTSETIMYEAYSKWIRSWKDLPLRLNQWTSAVRWEFKNPVPFLRTREFLWQEGHTAFASKEEAEKEVLEILDYYEEVYEKLLAVPVLKGKKSESEKFAGALYTTSVETIVPNGRAVQAATSHCLGQNFAKAFNITFTDKNEKQQHVWQNSWGLSTRALGIMIMVHSDDYGLVIPPKVAPVQIVIVPILFDKTRKQVLEQCNAIKQMLSGYAVHVDSRPEYSPGWKYNEWELKGIPLRIEIGPKDLEKKQLVLVRRDTRKKAFVAEKNLVKEVEKQLEEMQENLFHRAKKFLEAAIAEVKSFEELKKAAEGKKIAFCFWCGNGKCEEHIKDKANGTKMLVIPFGQHGKGRCVCCNKEAAVKAYFGKSY